MSTPAEGRPAGNTSAALQGADLEAFLRGKLQGSQWDVDRVPTWLIARPRGGRGSAHGWKLHVSARADTLVEVAELVIPVVIAEGCPFKLARSQEVLRELNDGVTAPATVGKAFTIYPWPDRVCALAWRLVEVLGGHVGPRILSDRWLSRRAPVYYRYGPFRPLWRADSGGRLTSVIDGPDGQTFDGLATTEYRQPEWIEDPFAASGGDAIEADHSDGTGLLGGRYRVIEGIAQSARGNVYRASQITDGRQVIVKQARAFVGEDRQGVDVRMRLRNERRILEALDGVERVPRFIDHFRHGDDEYLVTTDQGMWNLSDDVGLNGRYDASITDASGRSALSLAAQLASILCDIHERRVIVRDLTPRNIVLGDGSASIVDFGIAAFAGVSIRGATPGYAPPRQREGQDACLADDAYALGMTLLFAVSGLHPVTASAAEMIYLRAQQTLTSLSSELPRPIIETVRRLIDADQDAAIRMLRNLRNGHLASVSDSAIQAQPTVRGINDRILADITAHLRATLCEQATELLSRDSGGAPPGHDSSIYTGAAGLGLELIYHFGEPGIRNVLEDLAAFARDRVREVRLPPGLYVGSTGVEIFLQELNRQGLDVATLSEEDVYPPLPWTPEGDDLFIGAAGIGLGHLILHGYDHDARHLDRARSMADTICSTDAIRSPYDTDTPPPPQTAIDATAGRAHGLAGALALLLAVAERDHSYEPAARRLTLELARRTRTLIAGAHELSAAPLSVAWCRGLAGIAHTLLDAGRVLDDSEWTRLAIAAGDACRAWVPFLAMPGQCCGLAGVGGLFIRLAQSSDGSRFHAAATNVATQLLLRSGGQDTAPSFAVAGGRSPASWAAGTAGLLQFFRCLRSGSYADILPPAAEDAKGIRLGTALSSSAD